MFLSRERERESQLDQISVNRKAQEFKESYSAQICDLIDAILTDEKSLQQKSSSPSISKSCHLLTEANKKLRDLMELVQLSQGGVDIDPELTNELLRYKQKAKDLKKQKEQLELSYKEALENLDTKIEAEEKQNRNEGDLSLKQDASILTNLEILEKELKTAENAYERAVEAYNSKCCCLPSFLEKEINEVKRTEKTLKEKEAQILEIKTSQDKINAQIETKRKVYAELQASKLKLIVEHPQQQDVLARELLKAEEDLQSAQAIWDEEVRKKKAEVSNENMLYFLRVYVCFIQFHKDVVAATELQTKNTDLAHFRRRLIQDCIQLDICMEKIWCKDPARRNCKQVYQDIYLDLTATEKEAVVSGKFQPALINRIVPFYFTKPQHKPPTLFANPTPPVTTISSVIASSAHTIKRS